MSIENQLRLDPTQAVEKIGRRLRHLLGRVINRRGLVVAISGGVDSAVCAALAVQAIGPNRVFGLLLPERESSPASLTRGRMVVSQLGIAHEVFDITPALEAIGCYTRRDQSIHDIFPDYDNGWKNKIVIAGGQRGRFNYFKLVVQDPGGNILEKRLDLTHYLNIVAATSHKQRLRKSVEYHHADRLHYAVVGTPNRLEYELGFFVKNGDGSADIKPIAHLYKTQVYALADFLGLPEEICKAAPSTDTYSMAQGQDEFYFALPHAKMDVALFAYNNGYPASSLVDELGLTAEQSEFVFQDIAAKRKTTGFLHRPALLIENLSGPLPVVPPDDGDQIYFAKDRVTNDSF